MTKTLVSSQKNQTSTLVDYITMLYRNGLISESTRSYLVSEAYASLVEQQIENKLCKILSNGLGKLMR